MQRHRIRLVVIQTGTKYQPTNDQQMRNVLQRFLHRMKFDFVSLENVY